MGISRTEALDCFQSDDLIGIGMEADAVRRRLHPEGVVTYTLDGRLDYATPEDAILRYINDLTDSGGTSLMLQGTVHPEHTLTWFETLFTSLKKRFPTLWLHSLSATEIITIAGQSGLTVRDTIARLHDAGLDSIPSNDAGILDAAVQSPRAVLKPSDWLAVHRTAHQLGMQTTAAMVFGSGETFEHRVNHLDALWQLQQETGGFTSFTPWSFAPQRSAMRGFEEPTAVEYLKTLAISRMFLDNIENVQSNLETQGLKVLQVGLRFGGNDVGSVLLADGANATTEEQVRQVIRDSGFRPVQRDTLYRTMFLN
jgi:cyclic dehypoxanthinyl futalosine synthase